MYTYPPSDSSLGWALRPSTILLDFELPSFRPHDGLTSHDAHILCGRSTNHAVEITPIYDNSFGWLWDLFRKVIPKNHLGYDGIPCIYHVIRLEVGWCSGVYDIRRGVSERQNVRTLDIGINVDVWVINDMHARTVNVNV